MPATGGRKAQAEQGYKALHENLSGDDEARPDAETLLNVTLTMPASEQGDLRPPASPDVAAAAFSTSKVAREERHFTPDFQSNISPSLQEQFDCALREERFGDLKGIKDAMRAAEHGGVQQQLALALKEKRWLEAAHFCELISRSGDEQRDVISPPVQEQMPQQIKREPQFSTTSATAFDMAHEINTAHLLHVYDPPNMVISADIVPAVRMMLEATEAPVAAQPVNVVKDDPDNMGQEETIGCDYDKFDKMSNAVDKLKSQFPDTDARGGWKIFGQLPAWGDGAGAGDTWDPGPPTPFTSSKASYTLLHVISSQNAPL